MMNYPMGAPQGGNASDLGFGVRMNSWSGFKGRAYGWVLWNYKPPSADRNGGVVVGGVGL
jgi:hypothetical protein